jgi:uncharacterized protein YjbI with pentapeptide repeats
MANPDHINILKQGVAAWNNWRIKNRKITPQLNQAELNGAALSGSDFRGANLIAATLKGSILRKADLSDADLRGATFARADLRNAEFDNADLRWADLTGAFLRGATLTRANLSMAYLDGANLHDCTMNETILVDLDLRTVKGLETVEHRGPSTVSIDTVYRSKGTIPESFLRGAGVPEWLMANNKLLAGVSVPKTINFYSCFISYSSQDSQFAERLYADLVEEGVQCWFAPEDLKIGDSFHQRIDQAIHLHDKLMIVLSSNSIRSLWVQTEVESAFERERKQDRTMLFPIRLDDAVMCADKAWAADIRRYWSGREDLNLRPPIPNQALYQDPEIPVDRKVPHAAENRDFAGAGLRCASASRFSAKPDIFYALTSRFSS